MRKSCCEAAFARRIAYNSANNVGIRVALEIYVHAVECKNVFLHHQIRTIL